MVFSLQSSSVYIPVNCYQRPLNWYANTSINGSRYLHLLLYIRFNSFKALMLFYAIS